jgi:two-component system, NarL family, response regulator DevR
VTGPRVRLLLVDDHRVVRMGLVALFEKVPRFAVVGEAGTMAEAVAEAERCRPDVVVMDVRLPDGTGVEACREIRAGRPDTRVFMLTSYADQDAVVASIMAGAAGYLLKHNDPKQLIQAVDTVAGGGSLLDPAVVHTVLEWIRCGDSPGTDDRLAALSQQEHRVLSLVAAGKTNRDIAGALGLSEHTVKIHVSHILEKLRLVRRAEAAAFVAGRRLPGGGGQRPQSTTGR